jgi:hypothetical protein
MISVVMLGHNDARREGQRNSKKNNSEEEVELFHIQSSQ